MFDTTQIAAPLEIHTERVRPEWIDHNGHMNVAFYLMAFDEAAGAVAKEIGYTNEYRRANNIGTVRTSHQIRPGGDGRGPSDHLPHHCATRSGITIGRRCITRRRAISRRKPRRSPSTSICQSAKSRFSMQITSASAIYEAHKHLQCRKLGR